MLITGGKLDVLVCAVYIDKGVEADDSGEAECESCRDDVGADMDAGLIEGE